MDASVCEQSWASQETGASKRRKLSHFEKDWCPVRDLTQDNIITGSPNESADSSNTFFISPESSPVYRAESLYMLPRSRLMPLSRMTSRRALRTADGELCSSDSSDNTPTGQGIVLQNHLEAPRLRNQLPNEAVSPLWSLHRDLSPTGTTAPSAACGTKRLRLDSYSIASQLALGQAAAWFPQRESAPVVRSRQVGQHHALAGGRQIFVQPPHLDQLKGGSIEQVGLASLQQFSNRSLEIPETRMGAATSKRGLFSLHQPALECFSRWARTDYQQIPLHSTQRFVHRAPITASHLVERWACMLSLIPDTVFLALHMFSRIQAQVVNACSGSRGLHLARLYLLGCLWLAAKHEECRTEVPSAQKIAALSANVCNWQVQSSEVNQLELQILDLLGWQPLKGWDDLYNVKGRPRQVQEVYELKWLTNSLHA